MSDEEKRAAVPSKGAFTVKQYAQAADRSLGTAASYLRELLEARFIEEAGWDASSTAPRKPKLYRRLAAAS